MELMPGYKHSDVGVIPEDWNVRSLGEIATIKDGTHQTPQYQASGVPFYSVEHVTSGDFENTKFISEQEHQFLTRSFRIEKGDILMTRIGSIGECKLIDWDVRASFYVSLALLKIKDASAEYIAQYSNSSAFKREIELHSLQHATPKKINLGPISDVKIALPQTEKEQRAIARALSDVDTLLATLDQVIAKKRDLKQASMQQLLAGGIQLAGFGGKWLEVPLGDIVKPQKGQLITTKTIVPGDIPVIAGGKQPAYFHASANRCGKTITVSASGASAGYVAFHAAPIFASDCSTISESEKYCIEFIYYALQLRQEEIYAAQTGGAQPHIQPKDLTPILIKIPEDVKEQAAIASVLSDMDAEITELEARRDKTRNIKQAMMQELLTGKTRLV